MWLAMATPSAFIASNTVSMLSQRQRCWPKIETVVFFNSTTVFALSIPGLLSVYCPCQSQICRGQSHIALLCSVLQLVVLQLGQGLTVIRAVVHHPFCKYNQIMSKSGQSKTLVQRWSTGLCLVVETVIPAEIRRCIKVGLTLVQHCWDVFDWIPRSHFSIQIQIAHSVNFVSSHKTYQYDSMTMTYMSNCVSWFSWKQNPLIGGIVQIIP